MSLYNRRLFCLSFTAVAGCGFTPVYAPGGSAEGLRGRILVAAPVDEEGAALVRRLEDRLGRSSTGDLTLSADIRLKETAVGFLPDGELSRFNIDGQVDWELRDATDTAVAAGQERSFTSYSATSTTVATTFAQRDARRRLMVILADRIVADLISRDIS